MDVSVDFILMDSVKNRKGLFQNRVWMLDFETVPFGNSILFVYFP